MCCGYGCGADSVTSWISVNASEAEVEILVDFAVRVRGAKTVRYGFGSANSGRANGLVGILEDFFAFCGFFFEKGNREKRAADKEGPSESDVESDAPVEIWDVNNDLEKMSLVHLLQATSENSHQLPRFIITRLQICFWMFRSLRPFLQFRDLIFELTEARRELLFLSLFSVVLAPRLMPIQVQACIQRFLFFSRGVYGSFLKWTRSQRL